MFTFIGVLVVVGALLLFASVQVLPEYQRGVVLTVGRYTGTKGPGLVLLIPVVQRMVRVDLRITVMDVPPQDVISRDNVSVRVNAVVYFRVVQPDKSVLQVVNFLQATSQLAQTRLRSVLGQHELDEILSQRESINRTLQTILDEATDAWGIKVANVEIKDVDLNDTMVRAIARQAEAERERRAKVIHAEGELQAAEKLRDAAAMLSQQPQALQLRYLQTLADMSSNGKSSTIVFPLPPRGGPASAAAASLICCIFRSIADLGSGTHGDLSRAHIRHPVGTPVPGRSGRPGYATRRRGRHSRDGARHGIFIHLVLAPGDVRPRLSALRRGLGGITR